jgi:hypothetical protein
VVEVRRARGELLGDLAEEALSVRPRVALGLPAEAAEADEGAGVGKVGVALALCVLAKRGVVGRRLAASPDAAGGERAGEGGVHCGLLRAEGEVLDGDIRAAPIHAKATVAVAAVGFFAVSADDLDGDDVACGAAHGGDAVAADGVVAGT